MTNNDQLYHIFIASPSDVAEERDAVRDTIADWNAVNSLRRRIVLLPVGWETHAVPQMGVRPQEHINQTVLKDCDILIGIFWSRMGTDAGSGMTGTEEEIRRHVEEGKPAHLYFSNKLLPHEVDAEQLCRLRAFKEDIRRNRSGLYAEFPNLESFKSSFRNHLDIIVNGISAQARESSSAKPEVSLSDIAKLVLKKAAKSEYPYVLVKTTYIMVGGKHIRLLQEREQYIAVREAVDELVEREFLRDFQGVGERFDVTSPGSHMAETISDHFGSETDGEKASAP